ncbi:sulfatase family protein [Seonamhaeicola maritimus]|uniref:sulfatase family protein n=1 Tax=Seonamhaeicola maritimus TaxID=2591822 RepID=UPI002493D387|nr:sulfatase [Seonamhaeicola maritimus]
MDKLKILTWLGALFLFNTVNAQNHSKPNIIYIMTDDHAATAIGAYGSRLTGLNPTPNIDKLAKEGMLFTSAFCNNSICTPSRASILTGQYPQTNGVLDLDHALDIEKQYLPVEMKKLGYSTAIIGKWHLKNEPAKFDYYKVLPVQGKYFDPEFREKGKGNWPNNLVKHEGFSTDIITDLSMEYLKGRDKNKPFFLMHHHKAPHGPFSYPPRYNDFLENDTIPEPANLYSQPYFGSEATRGRNDSLIHYMGSSLSNRHFSHRSSKKSGALETHRAYQRYLKRYLRCSKGVDDNLGRLFDYLKKEGLWENTVIIYTSDQGMMLGEHDYVDKRWMYEESMQMPFIVHYPKLIRPETKSDLLINNTDFAPTMIELAGGKTPEYMQGQSFIRTLNGKEEKDWRTATYYRYWMHMIHHFVPAHFGIRTKDYKLTFYYSAHYLEPDAYDRFYWKKKYGEALLKPIPVSWEFYDLKNDPKEMINQYKNPKFQETLAELKKELLKTREELNETEANYPKLQKIIDAHWND